MTIRRINLATARADLGFSMIDVLIAIVVLATGLLALAALQGAMTRNSSDARARSQVAAYTQGLLDQLRAGGYDNVATATITPTSTTCPNTSSRAKEAYCAQTAAGVSNLSTTITATTYYGDSAGGWSTTAPSNLGAVAQFKQVAIQTTWTDALGQAGREVSFNTTMSSTALATTNTTLITQGFTGGPVTGPIVREVSPAATVGVIPIAINTSTSTNSAATNPAPVVTNTGATFSTFTYAPSTYGYAGVIISQRVDTKVIQCTCKYKASGGVVTNDPNLGTILAQPYRPTYWNGSQYTTPIWTKATVSTSTTSLTGIDSTVTQDTDCDIGCRDRNDGSTGDPPSTILFDSFSGDNRHFNYVSGAPAPVTSGDYVEAVRLIRINGTYATATDAHNYFFGLLGTDTCANQGTSADPSSCSSTLTASDTVPSLSTETNYGNFVIEYLHQSLTSFQAGTGPWVASTDPLVTNNASTLYNGSSYLQNTSSNVTITLPNTVSRWVYARGLYIDHLETDAVTALTTAINNCGTSPTTAQLENCALPVLPFTTVNMTELANWSSSATAVINVSDTAVIDGFSASVGPKRGNVTVPSTQNGSGTPSPTAYAAGSTYITNSGLTGVTVNQANSYYDQAASSTVTDQRQFTVTGSGSGSGGAVYFVAALTGLSWMSAISNASLDPSVSWSGTAAQLGAAASGAANAYLTSSGNGSNKTYTAQYAGTSSTVPVAVAESLTPPVGLTVNVQNFNTTASAGTETVTCTATSGGNPGSFTSSNATQCLNYAVSPTNITIGGVTVSGATSALMSGTTDGGQKEGAVITLPSTPGISSTTNTVAGATSLSIPFTLTATTIASGTCVCTNKSCSKTTYTAGICPN